MFYIVDFLISEYFVSDYRIQEMSVSVYFDGFWIETWRTEFFSKFQNLLNEQNI